MSPKLMQLCAAETACVDWSSSPLSFCRSRSSETANTANYGWTLYASCWIESQPWKVDRAVGTTCACASAYGRRNAPSLVGLDLSVSCVRDACRPYESPSCF